MESSSNLLVTWAFASENTFWGSSCFVFPSSWLIKHWITILATFSSAQPCLMISTTLYLHKPWSDFILLLGCLFWPQDLPGHLWGGLTRLKLISLDSTLGQFLSYPEPGPPEMDHTYGSSIVTWWWLTHPALTQPWQQQRLDSKHFSANSVSLFDPKSRSR